ncbi:hypothetical protein [Streptomyces sp. NPDC047043]|uniref:hypothetical protein n=1 Tax=Streptomyces sp. NPDC047043 TaxID=3154497 RepID=UPI0033C23E73
MSVTTRDSRDGPTRQKMLGIYLNDHLAGATTGTELARRMVQEHQGSAYAGTLGKLSAEISQDRQALLRLVADLDLPIRRYKLYGAWLGEKITRVKPNGRLLRRSGLTLLVELETLRTGVQGKASLWRSLLSASARDSRLDADWLEQLLDRAEQQIQALDVLHARAAEALLSPATPSDAVAGKRAPT